ASCTSSRPRRGGTTGWSSCGARRRCARSSSERSARDGAVALGHLLDRVLTRLPLGLLRLLEDVVLDRREREYSAGGGQYRGDLHPDLEAVRDRLRVLVVAAA